MVKIAIAGGSGQVAREVVDALVAAEKHQLIVLSRKSTTPSIPGVEVRHVDYDSKASLVEALQGVHTVLSFVQTLADPHQTAQTNLIDASIEAGVKRFAPSELASKGTVDMPWWNGKDVIRQHLQKVNEHKQVLEYTLFQPGLFLDYLAFPYKTATHVDPLQTLFDFEHRRAIVVEGHADAIMTFTRAADVAGLIAQAVEYQGTWPTEGGIRGNRLTFAEVIAIGEKIRGGPFTVETVKVEDLEAGNLNTSWSLTSAHPAAAAEDTSKFLKAVSIGILLSSVKGAWDSGDEFNVLLPDYKFASAQEFLGTVWADKS